MSALEQNEHAVALRPVTGNSLSEVKALGQVFKASGYFKDVRDEAQAVVKILYGRELGLTPIVAMMGIYIIEGKPSLSANVLAAVIKRSGHYDYRVKESTATRCLIEFREKGEVIGESEFTMEDAKAAGVANKDNWRKYSKAMLFARALSAGARMHCPDVGLCPIYVPEELGANVTEEGDVTELPKSARPVEVTTEVIELGSPALSSAGHVKGTATTVNNGGEHESQAAPAEQPENYYEKLKQEVTNPTYPPECVGNAPGYGPAFSRAWNAACPESWTDEKKTTERHAWLIRNGFALNGVGTSAMIQKAVFEETKKSAVKFAKGLK